MNLVFRLGYPSLRYLIMYLQIFKKLICLAWTRNVQNREKSVEAESEWLVGCPGGGGKDSLLMGMQSLKEDKNVLKLDSGDSYTTL